MQCQTKELSNYTSLKHISPTALTALAKWIPTLSSNAANKSSSRALTKTAVRTQNGMDNTGRSRSTTWETNFTITFSTTISVRTTASEREAPSCQLLFTTVASQSGSKSSTRVSQLARSTYRPNGIPNTTTAIIESYLIIALDSRFNQAELNYY